MEKNSSIVFVLLTLFVFAASTSYAAPTPTGCQPLYGGGPSCANTNLTIVKSVLNPQTNAFVPNLGISDPIYHPGDLITFQIKAGTSGPTIPQVTLKDTFPQNFLFSSGPGTYDTGTNTLTATGTNITIDKPFVVTITGRIPSVDKLGSTSQPLCENNQASVIADNNQPVQTTTQFCIQVSSVIPTSTTQTTKGGLPIYKMTNSKTTPPTGSETIFLAVFFLSAIIGWLSKKKAINTIRKKS